MCVCLWCVCLWCVLCVSVMCGCDVVTSRFSDSDNTIPFRARTADDVTTGSLGQPITSKKKQFFL